jgi:hypothetical protein
MLSEDDICDGSTFLVALANQVKPLRNTQLKGMMAAASQYQVTEAQLKKKYWRAGASAAIDQEPQPDYQLPFSTQPNVCHQNASSFTFA